jgi:F0F1-type ATP synthase epsilon subunit
MDEGGKKAKANGKENQKLQVMILSPEKLLYQGPALALTSYNEKGKFDILPQHTNFITLIKDRLSVQFDKDKVQGFLLDKGVIRCVDNKVKVYVGL